MTISIADGKPSSGDYLKFEESDGWRKGSGDRSRKIEEKCSDNLQPI